MVKGRVNTVHTNGVDGRCLQERRVTGASFGDGKRVDVGGGLEEVVVLRLDDLTWTIVSADAKGLRDGTHLVPGRQCL